MPLIGCPDCGRKVKFYVSGTEEHEGWVFYKCPGDGVSFLVLVMV